MMVPTHVIMTVLNKTRCPETGRHRRHVVVAAVFDRILYCLQ